MGLSLAVAQQVTEVESQAQSHSKRRDGEADLDCHSSGSTPGCPHLPAHCQGPLDLCAMGLIPCHPPALISVGFSIPLCVLSALTKDVIF